MEPIIHDSMRINNDLATTPTTEAGERDEVVALFQEAQRSNEARRKEIAFKLGPRIKKADMFNFERLLRTIDMTGDIDVTGWPRYSVRALLRVCAECKTWIAVKNGDRLLSPVSYPADGPILEMFVNAVMTGEWN
ncbi:MAG: hypothetical protein ACXAEF_10335 [Candidatus Thorarchaeota archaeon]|jgi:hypothetical protein